MSVKEPRDRFYQGEWQSENGAASLPAPSYGHTDEATGCKFDGFIDHSRWTINFLIRLSGLAANLHYSKHKREGFFYLSTTFKCTFKGPDLVSHPVVNQHRSQHQNDMGKRKHEQNDSSSSTALQCADAQLVSSAVAFTMNVFN